MAGPGGKLEKMLILAFSDAKKAENGGKSDADASYTALINPESFSQDYKIQFAEKDQASGASGKQLKYESHDPEELAFEFLFDNTGIIDGKPKESVADEVKNFKKLLMAYNGEAHEPRHLKLIWGDSLIFKGRATDLSITYKLFTPDGQPIRATAKVKFKGSIEDRKRNAQENKQSPDLTHFRRVKAGDTLHLMCQRIYGDARYYLQVAEVNGLGNFRRLTPGTELLFPPIDKTNN